MGPRREVVLPAEPAIGKPYVDSLALALRNRGFRVHLAAQRGPKKMRALPHAGLARPADGEEHGKVWLLRGPWNDRWASLHHAFTGEGAEDDHVVDAAAILYNTFNQALKIERIRWDQ